MDPLTFVPLIKQTRWGGRKLGTLLNKQIGAANDYAESWEIADQPDDQSIVVDGPFAGRTLREVMRENRVSLLGRQSHLVQFPLLIKFLDANDWLSVQVHPNDSQAVAYGPSENGKTEAWVIIDAEPESQLCVGLKQGVTRDDFERHMHAGRIEETLNMIPARVGDCIFVPAGTVHAIGPGIVLAEIQQQSDLTFRLYDWGRLGSDGRPRDVHIDEALGCIDFNRGPVGAVLPVPLYDGDHHFEEIVRCKQFVVRRHAAVDEFTLRTGERFRIIMMLEGKAVLHAGTGALNLEKGQTVLLPAHSASAIVRPAGKATLLEVLYP